VVPPTRTPPPPTPAPAPPTAPAASQPVSAADMDLIRQAVTTTHDLKSYHFALVATGNVLTQAVNLEGDYVAPDKAYAKGTVGGQPVEQLVVGDQLYRKEANGKWAQQAPSSDNGEVNPADMTRDANLMNGLGPLLDGSAFTDQGQEIMNGVSARHFVGNIDIGQLMGSAAGPAGPQGQVLGTISLWIDPKTRYVHKLIVDVDLAPLLKLLAEAFAGIEGTPGPGTPTATPVPASLRFNIALAISKHNDPSISVPAVPADAVPASTATSGPAPPEDTPVVETEATATPEAVETPGDVTPGPTESGKTYQLGEAAPIQDLSITVNSAKTIAGGDLMQPDAGMKFVVVDVTIENHGTTDAAISTLLEAELRDAGGTTYDVDIGAQVAAGGKGVDGTVPAKGKITGSIGYEVPENATGLQWVFKDFVTDETVVFDIAP
jgi:hypothetical protein